MDWNYLILLNTSIFALILGWIDFKTNLLPNRYVFLLFLTSVLIMLGLPNRNINNVFMSLIVSLFVFLIYCAIYLISKRSFGLGDVKYSFSLSFPVTYVYGISGTINLHIAAFVLGGIFAGILMIFKKVSKNHVIAFGPFMSLSYFLVIVLNL